MTKRRAKGPIQGNFTTVDPVETHVLTGEGSTVQQVADERRKAIVKAGLGVLVKRHSEIKVFGNKYELTGVPRRYSTKYAPDCLVRLDGTLALEGRIVTVRTLARTGLEGRIDFENSDIGLHVQTHPDAQWDFLFGAADTTMDRFNPQVELMAAMTNPQANYLSSLIRKLGA